MPFDSIIHEDLKLIEIIPHGDITREDIFKSLQIVEDIREKHSFSNVLVDARQVISYPGTIDIYDFSIKLSQSTSGKVKFAVLVKANIDKDMNFLITVVCNRGGAAKVFYSKEEALNWVKK